MWRAEDAAIRSTTPEEHRVNVSSLPVDTARLRALLARLDPQPGDAVCHVPGCVHQGDHEHLGAPGGVPIAA
jgi:hypothetical protein